MVSFCSLCLHDELLTTPSPGRFYASAVMKVILGQMILNYDCELLNPNEKRLFTWRSTILPKPSAKVVFTPVRA